MHACMYTYPGCIFVYIYIYHPLTHETHPNSTTPFLPPRHAWSRASHLTKASYPWGWEEWPADVMSPMWDFSMGKNMELAMIKAGEHLQILHNLTTHAYSFHQFSICWACSKAKIYGSRDSNRG